MHRTLFTASMVETFRSCKRAYELAYLRYANGTGTGKMTGACKRFLLKTLAEINRDRITSVQQLQKFMGQHWPLDKLDCDNGREKDNCTRAFLFAYKALNTYSHRPYRPPGSEVAGVAVKVRVRVAHVRVYVEDTIDMVLWNPTSKKLELVNFQTQPAKPINPAWPPAAVLIKYYLAQRLKLRWPFEKLVITTVRVGAQETQVTNFTLDESIFRVHWEELVRTLEEMKEPPAELVACSSTPSECKYCASLKQSSVQEVPSIQLTA